MQCNLNFPKVQFLFFILFIRRTKVSLYLTIQIQKITKITYINHNINIHKVQKEKNTTKTITRTKNKIQTKCHVHLTLVDRRQGITIHKLFDLSKQIEFRDSKESWKISKRCAIRLADFCIRSIA